MLEGWCRAPDRINIAGKGVGFHGPGAEWAGSFAAGLGVCLDRGCSSLEGGWRRVLGQVWIGCAGLLFWVFRGGTGLGFRDKRREFRFVGTHPSAMKPRKNGAHGVCWGLQQLAAGLSTSLYFASLWSR